MYRAILAPTLHVTWLCILCIRGIWRDYYFSHIGIYSFLIVYFTRFVKCKRGLCLCDMNII